MPVLVSHDVGPAVIGLIHHGMGERTLAGVESMAALAAPSTLLERRSRAIAAPASLPTRMVTGSALERQTRPVSLRNNIIAPTPNTSVHTTTLPTAHAVAPPTSGARANCPTPNIGVNFANV